MPRHLSFYPEPECGRGISVKARPQLCIAWGYDHPGTLIIVDDLAARRCAATLGIPVRGTLGLVLTAKKRGVIPEARPVLEQLRQSGMYLSDRILSQALALVEE